MAEKRCGIYQIRHIESGRAYIGHSVNILKRWNKHRQDLTNNKHHSPHLQWAWNKHGKESFVFEVLEECAPVRATLVAREQHYLDTLDPFYNGSKTANSPLGFKHTPEHHARTSASLIGNQRAKGFKHSVETRAKVSEVRKVNTNRRGKPDKPETREKKRLAHLGLKQTPEAIANRLATIKRKALEAQAQHPSPLFILSETPDS